MKYFFISIFVFTFSFHSISQAQIIENLGNDVSHFFTTGGKLADSFFQFKSSTQIGLAGSAALIAAGYSLDYNMKKFAGRNHSDFNNSLFSIDEVYGSEYSLIGISALYGYGLFLNDPGVRKLGLQTIEAVGYAGLITSIIKAVVGRSRPYTNEGHARFRPFNVHAAYTSFPSGHATVSFAISTVLADNTNNIFLKILCYTASTLVFSARIYHNAHWFSDVITGGLIGHFVGDFVSNQANEKKSGDNKLSFYVLPEGVGFSYNF